jgi:protein involved in polysaccharide export with SLBB domain
LELIKSFEFSFNENYQTNNDILLKRNDVITVRLVPFDRSSEFYSINGEVSVPGSYPILRDDLSVAEIIDNLDYTRIANTNQIYLIRDGLKVPINYENKTNLLIVSGDNLVVPQINNTVKVNGAVQQISTLDYQLNKSFKKSIVNSGGFANNADKKRSYVVYPNGLKKQTRSFLFIKKYPKIIPGSELVVPIKQEKESRSAAELIGITSSITSLVAIIRLITQ